MRAATGTPLAMLAGLGVGAINVPHGREKAIRTRRKNMSRPDACGKCFYRRVVQAQPLTPLWNWPHDDYDCIKPAFLGFGRPWDRRTWAAVTSMFCAEERLWGFPKGGRAYLKVFGFFSAVWLPCFRDAKSFARRAR